VSAFSSKNYPETRRADRPSKESEEKSQSAPEDYAHDGNSKRDNKDPITVSFSSSETLSVNSELLPSLKPDETKKRVLPDRSKRGDI